MSSIMTEKNLMKIDKQFLLMLKKMCI